MHDGQPAPRALPDELAAVLRPDAPAASAPPVPAKPSKSPKSPKSAKSAKSPRREESEGEEGEGGGEGDWKVRKADVAAARKQFAQDSAGQAEAPMGKAGQSLEKLGVKRKDVGSV